MSRLKCYVELKEIMNPGDYLRLENGEIEIPEDYMTNEELSMELLIEENKFWKELAELDKKLEDAKNRYNNFIDNFRRQ